MATNLENSPEKISDNFDAVFNYLKDTKQILRVGLDEPPNASVTLSKTGTDPDRITIQFHKNAPLPVAEWKIEKYQDDLPKNRNFKANAGAGVTAAQWPDFMQIAADCVAERQLQG